VTCPACAGHVRFGGQAARLHQLRASAASASAVVTGGVQPRRNSAAGAATSEPASRWLISVGPAASNDLLGKGGGSGDRAGGRTKARGQAAISARMVSAAVSAPGRGR